MVDVINLDHDIPEEKYWTISFKVRKKIGRVSDIVEVDVHLWARDIHQAIEKACQYYAENEWEITDVFSR